MIVRIGRGLLFSILLAGTIFTGWAAFRPALREVRAEQRLINDLSYTGMIAENAELLLADPPDDLPGAIGEMLLPLFEGEESLAAARVWNANGKLLCEVGRNDSAPRKTTALANLPAPEPPAPLTADRQDILYQMQQLLTEQGGLSANMDAALQAGKGAGVHTGLYAVQGNNLDLARELGKKAALIRNAMGDMDVALQALSHSDTVSLKKALRASQNAEEILSLALEQQRAVTDFPGALPSSLVAAAEQQDLLNPRARRVTAPLFITTDETLLAPAGTAEVIFYDRPAANALTAAHRVFAFPRRWAPPAAFLLAALITLFARKRNPRYKHQNP